ncbi:MAG: hypothetical protein ACMXYG_00290 [Candidatus Woesearchaeota archaeon]
MNQANNQLTEQEIREAQKVFHKLEKPDLNNVKKVIESVDDVANMYYEEGDIDYNYIAFCKDGRVGYPFFAVYLIGGYLNKEGERKDIDLIIATNMRWTNGFTRPEFDDPISKKYLEPIWAKLTTTFSSGYSINKHNELPTDYNLGVTQGKVLITIKPENGKPLDINYVKSWNRKDFKFIDEEQFHKLDVTKSGEPIPKLALYRSKTTVNVPKLRW